MFSKNSYIQNFQMLTHACRVCLSITNKLCLLILYHRYSQLRWNTSVKHTRQRRRSQTFVQRIYYYTN
jgi:hypothetical protein